MQASTSTSSLQELLRLNLAQHWRDRQFLEERFQALLSLVQGLRRDAITNAGTHSYGSTHIDGGNVQLGDRYFYLNFQDPMQCQTLLTNGSLTFTSPISHSQTREAMAQLGAHCVVDHLSTLRTFKSLCQTARKSSRPRLDAFLQSRHLQEWNDSPQSSQVFLQTPYQERFSLRAFYMKLIDQLMQADILILYILGDRSRIYTLHEVLKSLITQSVAFNYTSNTDTACASRIQQFNHARTTDDYLNILGEILTHFKLAFLIVNSEAMDTQTAVQCRFALSNLIHKLAARQVKTVVRVLTTTCTPTHRVTTSLSQVEEKIIRIDGARGGTRPTPCSVRSNPLKRPFGILDSSDKPSKEAKRARE